MTDMLFDRVLYARRRQASAKRFDAHAVFHHEAMERAAEALGMLRRRFERTLIIGAPDTRLSAHPSLGRCLYADLSPARLPLTVGTGALVADEEWLPVADGALDAVISIFSLHQVNDLPGALIQMRRALRPDGLLLAILPGARSLHELRASLAAAEAALCGGISPRVAPFPEVRDAGGLLQRAGFALPVVESETLVASYPDLGALMAELRGAGEANTLSARQRRMTPARLMALAQQHYQTHFSDAEGRLAATLELLTLSGWSPHPSQQQPAARGSATQSMRSISEAP